MARQEERRALTRASVIVAAERLFGSDGFGSTTMEDIAVEAGVAKGAVYHYFKSKRDVFEAVFEAVSAELARTVMCQVRTDGDMIKTLISSAKTFFALCANPATLRILLQDGPVVLGLHDWQRLDARDFGGLVTASLGIAMDAGAIARQPLEPLSHIMLAAIQAAAINCAASPDFQSAADSYLAALESILVGLSASSHLQTQAAGQ